MAAGVVLALPGPAVRAETPASDSLAVAVATRVMEALGGHERWDRLRYLRWSFEVSVNDTIRTSRRHAWDKHTGWHRVEGKDRSGRAYCYIENLGDSTGVAWVDGQRIEGDSLRRLMRSAHAAWINDSYWFLMPYKLRDPGVTLKYEGEVTGLGGAQDRIALSFQDVGLTPGDRYWVLVDRASHRVVGWEYLLQGAKPPPLEWTWEGWEQHDGLWFPTAHRSGNRVIYTRAIETAASAKSGEFSSP